MIKRILFLIGTKIKSIFSNSLSFSSRIEYSKVSSLAKVWGDCKIFHSTIGDYSYIGRHCRVIHAHIGKFCSIAGDYSQIGMGKHSLSYISTSSLFTEKRNGTGSSWSKTSEFEEYDEIVIGNDVWVGSTVKIMPGVHIGNGAVIGAGAIVTKDVPPYAIVVGVPAKVIRYRFPEEVIKKMEESKWWELDEDILKEHISLFQRPMVDDDLEKLLLLCNRQSQC